MGVKNLKVRMGRGFPLLLLLACTAVVRASGLMTGHTGAGSPMECDGGEPVGTEMDGRFNIHGKELVAYNDNRSERAVLFWECVGGVLRRCGSIGGVQWKRCHPDDH
jgi:hypothetical protein